MLNNNDIRRFILAISIGAYLLAIYFIIYPFKGGATGIRGDFYNYIYEKFGSYSIPVLCFIVGLYFTISYVNRK